MSPTRRQFALLVAIIALASAAPGSTEAATPQRTITAIPLDSAAIGFGAVMQARAQTLRPAPPAGPGGRAPPAPPAARAPDQDVSAPGPSSDELAAEADPSVTPDLFNPKAHFAGDGYAAGSSIEGDQNHRHSTGGGMSLSIPME